MKRPTFMEGLGVGFISALAAGVGFSALRSLLPAHDAAVLIVTSLGLGYLMYLLLRSATRTGRLTVVASWVVITGALFVFGEPLLVHIGAQLLAVWLVRSLYFHNGVLTSFGDLVLIGIGFVAGVGTLSQTNSVFLSVWSFFLVQALFVCLPAHLLGTAREARADANATHDFAHAHRNAEAAIRKMTAG